MILYCTKCDVKLEYWWQTDCTPISHENCDYYLCSGCGTLFTDMFFDIIYSNELEEKYMNKTRTYEEHTFLEAVVNSIVLFIEYPIMQPLLTLLAQHDSDYWMEMLEQKLKEKL